MHFLVDFSVRTLSASDFVFFPIIKVNAGNAVGARFSVPNASSYSEIVADVRETAKVNHGVGRDILQAGVLWLKNFVHQRWIIYTDGRAFLILESDAHFQEVGTRILVSESRQVYPEARLSEPWENSHEL
jgi:hypothetical protein